MKRLILLIAFLAGISFSTTAQVNPQISGAGAPSGPCTSGQQYLDTTNHVLYNCSREVWVKIGLGNIAPNMALLHFTSDPTGTGCVVNQFAVNDNVTGSFYGCWNNVFVAVSGGGGSFTAAGDLSGTSSSQTVIGINGTLLSGLATGLLKNTTATGAASIAIPGTDYVVPSGNITGTAAGLSATLVVASGGTGLATLTSNAIYKGNGTGVELASSLSDNGTTVSTAEPVSAASYSSNADGVHPTIIEMVGNTTEPAVDANTAGFEGPGSATFTAYRLKLPATGPTTALPILSCPTPSTSVSACSFVAAGSAAVSSNIPFGPGAGSVNVMTVTTNTGTVTNVTGQMVAVQTNLANTSGTPTLNVDGAGALTVKKIGSVGTLIALGTSDWGTTAQAAYATFVSNGTNWILLNPINLTPGNVNATALAASNQLNTGNVASVAVTSSLLLQVTDANGANASSTGSLQARGGNQTGTGTTTASSAEFGPGGVTSATGTPGLVWNFESYLAGATVTVGNLECISSTTAMTVTDCGASPTSVIGIAETSTNPVMLVISGEMFVNASSAVTVGHTVCAGATAGKVTDSGGLTACTLGTEVGIVIATSGTFNLPTSGTQTATTTFPLIHMKVD